MESEAKNLILIWQKRLLIFKDLKGYHIFAFFKRKNGD